jgi:hypothetical protein
MNALVYILSRSFKNTLKGLIRKPAALIAYIIIAFFFIAPAIFGGSDHQPVTAGMSKDVVKSIITGYSVFLLVISLISSLNGASFFRMADVNLLFTAPLKAGYILVYGFIKQLGASIMVMLFLALQYPNWKRSFGFNDGAGWILIASYMLLITISSLVGMLLYAFVSKKPARISWTRKIIYVFVIAFIMPIVINTITTGDLLNSIVAWLSNDNLKFIPIIGWFREILMGVYVGFNREIVLYLFLILLISIVAFICLYQMDTGFYENVLFGTELKEKAFQASREGKKAQSSTLRKYRKVKANFTMEGSLAIFQKQILEKRKKGLLLLPTRTIIMVTGAIIAALSIPANSMELMLGILAVAAYLMLIMNMAAAWESDLSYHYIYLIPASAFKKMLSATLSDVINIFIEGVLIFGAVGLILRVGPPIVLSVIAAYIALGVVFIYSDLVVRRMFGKIHGNVLRIFFRVFLLMIIALFAVVPAVIIFIAADSYALALLVSALINIILALLFMWIGVGLFKSPEVS